jgi:hypothetical protein
MLTRPGSVNTDRQTWWTRNGWNRSKSHSKGRPYATRFFRKAECALRMILILFPLCKAHLKAGIDLPYRAIQAEIGDLIDLVIHIERRYGNAFAFPPKRVFNSPCARHPFASLRNRCHSSIWPSLG